MQNKYQYKKLGDICDKASSNVAQNKIEGLDGDFPIFGASGYIQNVNFYHQDKTYIGVVKDGSGVGRVNIYPAQSSLLGTMQYVIPKEGYNIGFVAYVLKSLKLSSFATGAAIPHIYFKDYGQCMIPVPPLEEQERIVAELDLLTGVIEKQKAQLKELDNLAQSIFYDMFGDPVKNEKGWKLKKIGDVLKTTSGGTPSKNHAEYYDGGTIPWINSGELHQMYISDVKKYITRAGVENSSAKIFPVNSVLVAMYGATVGEVSILQIESTTNQAVCCIFPSPLYTPIFLYSVIKNSKNYFIEISAGGAQPNISQGVIKNFRLITPSIDIQQQFAEKIEAIEHQKTLIKKSIEETQKLFDYTMDKYFG